MGAYHIFSPGAIILKWVCKYWNGRAWAWFTWVETGTSCGLLWTRLWTFRFHKIKSVFLSSWRTISFSQRTLFHGVSHPCESVSSYVMVFVRHSENTATYCVMWHETAQWKKLAAVGNIPLYQPAVYPRCHYNRPSATSQWLRSVQPPHSRQQHRTCKELLPAVPRASARCLGKIPERKHSDERWCWIDQAVMYWQL